MFRTFIEIIEAKQNENGKAYSNYQVFLFVHKVSLLFYLFFKKTESKKGTENLWNDYLGWPHEYLLAQDHTPNLSPEDGSGIIALWPSNPHGADHDVQWHESHNASMLDETYNGVVGMEK